MDAFMAARSFRDPQTVGAGPLGNQFIASIAEILFEYARHLVYSSKPHSKPRCLTRYKNAVALHPALGPLALRLQQWCDEWLSGISASPPSFDDPFRDTPSAVRDHISQQLRIKVRRVVDIVEREQDRIARGTRDKSSAASATNTAVAGTEGVIASLRNSYEGPGGRHDNDFADVDLIRVAPTHEELICPTEPFLPGNFFGAPHHHPDSSMERLLDIQFRLLREELTLVISNCRVALVNVQHSAPLRTSVQAVMDDLAAPASQKTTLFDLIAKGGGKYRTSSEGGTDSVLFNLYTNVVFSALTPDKRGVTAILIFDTPPGRARASDARSRAAFWEGQGGKRLMQGGLVALVWKDGAGQISAHLGTIASWTGDFKQWAQAHADTVSVRVAFFDPAVELRILETLKNPERDRGATRVLVEASVMFEAVRPFLEGLRRDAATVPFARYLVHQPVETLKGLEIDPPMYARAPGFSFQLKSLFDPGAEVEDLLLSVNDPQSVETARSALHSGSRLDPSQADAIIAALTSEVALIQGPPGTGKVRGVMHLLNF
jgi:hypothetical protein